MKVKWLRAGKNLKKRLTVAKSARLRERIIQEYREKDKEVKKSQRPRPTRRLLCYIRSGNPRRLVCIPNSAFFKSNVLSLLLDGSECWTITAYITNKLDVFSVCCIWQICWVNIINNKDLMRPPNVQPIALQVKKRRRRWLGQVCRIDDDDVTYADESVLFLS